jgi:hypothetical protein
MALKRLDKIAETKPVVAGSDRPSIRLDGDLVSKFNKAVSDQKDAEARVGEVRTKLLEKGISHLYEHNIGHPTAPVKTIELTDKTGSAVRLTSQAKYSAANPEAADALFDALALRHPDIKIDINDYVQEAVTASFDSKIFQDSDGRFNEKIYLAFAAAVEKVTKELVAKQALPSGTVSPMKTTKKVVPLGTFDEQRYVLFDAIEEQNSIREVLPNTITLTPV